jgi:CBS domain containing-hemolysin-like protein
LIVEKLTKNLKDRVAEKTGLNRVPKFYNLVQIGFTFVLVNLGWIFFRSNSLRDAFYVLKNMFANINLDFSNITLGTGRSGLIIIFASIIFMEIVHIIQEQRGIKSFISERAPWARWSAYILIVVLILMFGAFNGTAFIYFQF